MTSAMSGNDTSLRSLRDRPFELLKELEKRSRAVATGTVAETSLIPIIMVTTKGQETDRVWGLRQGAVDYLVKPVSAQALVEKAQAALAV